MCASKDAANRTKKESKEEERVQSQIMYLIRDFHPEQIKNYTSRTESSINQYKMGKKTSIHIFPVSSQKDTQPHQSLEKSK